jgi:hypothetical protein
MRQTVDKILDSLSGADEALHPLSTSTLKTETTKCYETLVSIHKSIRRHVKADEKSYFVNHNEHGGRKILRNLDTSTRIYSASHVRRQTPSNLEYLFRKHINLLTNILERNIID